MTRDQANTSAPRKRNKLWLVFILALSSTAGAAYLGLQQMDWQKNLAPLQRAAIEAPPAQALAPARIAPSFDVVSADAAGMVVAAGRAQAGAAVLLRNDEQTLGETQADAHGEWVLTLERPLPAGDYNLSLLSVHPKTQERVPGEHRYALTIAPRDEGAAQAQTAAAISPQRITSPPAAVAAAPAPADRQRKNSAKVAAVKRGDTLWAMAHRYYGSGMRYSEIAGANKEQIKDPNLIFPKQQLSIPGDNAR